MRVKRLITALAIATFASFLAATGANAHTDAIKTSPSDGAVLEVPPATISVTFSEPPITEGAAIVMSDVSGNKIAVGPVEFDGAKISVASPPDLPAGEYKVTWRISAEDGHALTGDFGFTFNGDVIVSNATPMISAYSTDVASQSSSGSGAPETASEPDSNAWIILLVAFAASSVLGTLYVSKRRK